MSTWMVLQDYGNTQKLPLFRAEPYLYAIGSLALKRRWQIGTRGVGFIEVS